MLFSAGLEPQWRWAMCGRLGIGKEIFTHGTSPQEPKSCG